jgi:hypothetical protein
MTDEDRGGGDRVFLLDICESLHFKSGNVLLYYKPAKKYDGHPLVFGQSAYESFSALESR